MGELIGIDSKFKSVVQEHIWFWPRYMLPYGVTMHQWKKKTTYGILSILK